LEPLKNTLSKNVHRGSSFDSFLEEEGILDEVKALVAKRTFVHQLETMARAAALLECDLDIKVYPATLVSTLQKAQGLFHPHWQYDAG
jgi:ribosomal protein S4